MSFGTRVNSSVGCILYVLYYREVCDRIRLLVYRKYADLQSRTKQPIKQSNRQTVCEKLVLLCDKLVWFILEGILYGFQNHTSKDITDCYGCKNRNCIDYVYNIVVPTITVPQYNCFVLEIKQCWQSRGSCQNLTIFNNFFVLLTWSYLQHFWCILFKVNTVFTLK